MSFYNCEAGEVITELASSKSGLTHAEASTRLKKNGPNSIKLKRQRSLVVELIEPFKSAFVLILIIAATISLILDKRLDATVIIAIILINAVIYYAQSFSANRALDALKKKDLRQAVVIRGGRAHRINVDRIVPGDLALLSEGVKIPADGRLIEESELSINESILTGESLPVSKSLEVMTGNHPIYEQTNMVFQGTFVNSGIGRIVVTATGNDTEMAKIAKLSQDQQSLSPMQRKIDNMTSKIVIGAITISTTAFILGVAKGVDLTEMLRFTMSLTVAAVPEGLPIALTVILIFGVRRMAAKNALVRNLHAVETLGQTTLIATDKTGTITKNQLTIAHRWHPGDRVGELDEAAWLSLADGHHHGGDPIDKLIASQLDQNAPAGWHRERVIPFNQTLRASGAIWKTPSGYVAFYKGAPEVLLTAAKINANQKKQVENMIHRLSGEGHRLIGFASAKAKNQLSTSILPKDLKFEGIIAFSDQLRPEIPAAIQATHDAGIKVIMLTGDHLETARSFGKLSGIIQHDMRSAEGSAVERMTLSQIKQLLKSVRVFGRVLPEHKYKILQAVDRSEVTAMTGDGVNDVPAIVKADVGLAMGNGTDVAKEASDVVLLDNNYATIVEAIKEGRTILANVRKMIFFLFSTTVGEFMIMIGALVTGLPLPLSATQILWVNLVTDGIAVVPLGLEPPEGHQMKRAPERVSDGLIKKPLLIRVILTSVAMAALVIGTFWLYLPVDLIAAQTMAFAVLVAVQWANALNARSDHATFLEGLRRPNFPLWGVLVLSMLIQALVFWGSLQNLLGTVSIGSREISVIITSFVLMLLAGDLIKRIAKRFQKA